MSPLEAALQRCYQEQVAATNSLAQALRALQVDPLDLEARCALLETVRGSRQGISDWHCEESMIRRGVGV